MNELSTGGEFRRYIVAGALLGIATFALGIVLAPERTWASFLLVDFLLLGLGLAGAVFVALQYALGAAWAVALRRVPEAMAGIIPFAGAGMFILFLVHPSLYPWTHAGEEHVAAFRHLWLSVGFFLVRALVYVVIWTSLAGIIIGRSRRQDEDGSIEHTRRNVRTSVVFIIVFAFTFCLASFDWIMSLEPEWYSTIFGIYNFAGLFSGGIAALILLALWLEKAGPLRGVLREEHLHDLGKLLFAFCTFWMYIWFSQYMLIWYANIPEESTYFVKRLHGNWQPVFLLNVLLNWAVPFLALLSRSTKRNRTVLGQVAAVVLVGRWLDLYLMIVPTIAPSSPVLGIWEVGLTAGGAALFLYLFATQMQRSSPVPLHDPRLQESLHYHT